MRLLYSVLPTIESVRSGKIGGQLGHAPYARLALPPARVDHVREYRLERCVVIDRNLTQGTRSICGHQRRQRLWTAAATCHQQGRSRTDYQCVAIQVWPSKRGHPSVAIQVWPSKRPSQATYPRSWARRALNGYKKSMSLSAAWKSPRSGFPPSSCPPLAGRISDLRLGRAVDQFSRGPQGAGGPRSSDRRGSADRRGCIAIDRAHLGPSGR